MTEDVFRYETAPERRQWIVETLNAQGFISVAELVGRLGVSDMTVRRDLRKLEEAGDVRVVRGGVHLPAADGRRGSFAGRASANAEAKRAVALSAGQLIAEDDAIALDAGTTVGGLTDALPEGFAGSVVTHSVPVIQELLVRGEPRVIGLGGDLYPVSKAFVGPMTVDAASRVRVRTFFLGAAALDARGVYVDSDVERPTKHALMEVADRVVLLADASKFTTSAPVRLCDFADIDVLVTDAEPPPDVHAALAEHAVTLRVAPSD